MVRRCDAHSEGELGEDVKASFVLMFELIVYDTLKTFLLRLFRNLMCKRRWGNKT